MKKTVLSQWVVVGLSFILSVHAGAACPPFSVQNFNLDINMVLNLYDQFKNTSAGPLNRFPINPNISTMQVTNLSGTENIFSWNLFFYDMDYSATAPVARMIGFQTLNPVATGSQILNFDSVNKNSNIDGYHEENWIQSQLKYSNNSGVDQVFSLLQAKNFVVAIVDACTGQELFRTRLLFFIPPSTTSNPAHLISPVDVIVASPLPSFSWSPVARASHYVLTVAEDASFSNPVLQSGNIFTTSYLYGSNHRILENGKRYFWQIQSFTSLGKVVGGYNGKSVIGQFTVVDTIKSAAAGSDSVFELERLIRQASPDPFAGLEGWRLSAVRIDKSPPSPRVIKSLNADLVEKKAAIFSVKIE